MKTVLQIQNLRTAYFVGSSKEKTVHGNISAQANGGELVCILGLNGSGKSTLIRTILGMQKSGGGEVSFMGNSLKSISIGELAKMVSVVLTDKIDDAFLRVVELVSSGRYPYRNFNGRLNSEDLKIVDNALKLMKVSQLKNNLFAQLSDGEKQRVLIARAIAQDTPLIVLDEPAAFIDSPGKIGIMELLRLLTKESGKTILMTTHDIESALNYADTLWVLGKNGEFETGEPKEMIDKGMINKYFDNDEVGFNKFKLRFEKNH